MSSPVYKIPLFSETNQEVVFVFDIPPCSCSPLNDDGDDDDEFTVRIIKINDFVVPENSQNKVAVAKTRRIELYDTFTFASVLKSIKYKDQLYLPEDGIYYWFPPLSFSSKEKTRQKKPIDGLIQIQLQNTTEIDSIYASPLHSIPFMDLTGAFRYEYIAISYTKKTRETQTACNIIKTKMHITLIEIDDRFTEMLDNATGIRYSIERTFVFRQIQVNKTSKNNIKHSI